MDKELLLTTLSDLNNILFLGLSLFIAGAIEAFLWKTTLFQYVNYPIAIDWFGANKKWRGLISLPLTTIISICFLKWICQTFFPEYFEGILFLKYNCWELGLLVGLVFNLSELPNSFIKRRLNIPPGDESSLLFFFIDHMDSTYGILILLWLYFQFPLHFILTGAIAAPLLFMGATGLRKKLGLK
jgi:hypothetical protein